MIPLSSIPQIILREGVFPVVVSWIGDDENRQYMRFNGEFGVLKWMKSISDSNSAYSVMVDDVHIQQVEAKVIKPRLINRSKLGDGPQDAHHFIVSMDNEQMYVPSASNCLLKCLLKIVEETNHLDYDVELLKEKYYKMCKNKSFPFCKV